MAVQLAVQLHLHLQYNRSCTAVQLARCYISMGSTIGNHIRIVLALLGRNGSPIGSTITPKLSSMPYAP